MQHFYGSSKVAICFVLVVFLATGVAKAQHLVINEAMSLNSGYLSDEDGSFEDWIEIHNAGTESINIEGYGLSDDAEDPFKWTFPDYEIQAGEYLLIWASGKDRKPVPGTLQNGIQRAYYPDIPGTSVDDLINHESFPDHPSGRNTITGYFEAPTNIANNYGQHLYTWLVAPYSGLYRFQIASDDNSKLYLSSDDSPENATLIAEVPDWTNPREWYKYPEQISDYITLQQGQAYYISALMKEGSGGDNLALRWQLPDGGIEEPLKAVHCFLPSARWHTNFSISAEERVILTHPEGHRLDEMPPHSIPFNISYGRLPENDNQWHYFSEPTPEAANIGDSFSGITEKPTLSPMGGVFNEAIQISINSPDPGAQIYYTLNGSLPGVNNGMIYQNPIEVNNTLYIRALAISEGKLPSSVAATTYSVTHNNINSFSSNLPLMVLHQFQTAITPGERTTAFMRIWDNEEGGRVQLTNNSAFDGRITINIRGSSSQIFPKKGYGFHTLEEDESNRKVALLGMPEEHNWILHGPFSDKTLMRNVISYAIAPDAGHYSPRTSFVELFLHGGNSQLNLDNYQGVYVLTERIKIDPGRVDIKEMEPHHNTFPEVSGGYIFSIDRLNSGETGFTTARGTNFRFVRPNESTITPAQKNYLTGYLDSLETALFGDSFTDPLQGYNRFLDAPSFVDMHLITELTKEIDGYRYSTFFHKDRQGKIRSGPIWDFNLAFGNADYLEGNNPIGWYYELLDQNSYMYGWYTRLFEDPSFASQYNRRYRSLRLTAFSDIRLNSRIMENYNLLMEAQERNFEKWTIMGQYVWPNGFVGETYQEEVMWMADWLTQRLEWMDSQLGEAYSMIHYWNFNDTLSYLQPTYSISGASINITPGPASEITTDTGQDFNGINARSGDKAGHQLRINNPAGTVMEFHVSSADYKNLFFSYEARRSANGANTHYLSYTQNGTQYIPLDTIVLKEKTQLVLIDLETIISTNNNANLGIKIIMDYNPGYEGGLTGNNRLDNFNLDGEALTGVVSPPVQVAMLENPLELIAQTPPLTVDLNQYFRHPDNTTLIYVITGNDISFADVSAEEQYITITPYGAGGSEIFLEVHDGVNPPLKRSFYLLVNPVAAELSKGDYTFDFWNPDEPQGSFPENMLFVQSKTDDPGIAADLHFAYSIPASDYAPEDQANIGFPYRNQYRTRINGLNANGISFVNTGRGRDLGAAILAIDSRDLQSSRLLWEASTIQSNARVYNLRLQYRTTLNNAGWKDWLDEQGKVIEYKRSSSSGHMQLFENITFPEELLGKRYAQIRWLYYFTGHHPDNNGGARDMIGLHKIVAGAGITSGPEHSTDNQMVKLTAYPNPVTTGTIYLNKKSSGFIYDINGNKAGQLDSGTSINVQKLSNGIYLFKSANGETVRFIVIK